MMEATQVEGKGKDKPPKLVSVTLLTIDPGSGDQVEQGEEVAKGKTEVEDLKQELEVPAELSLWVIDKDGQRVRLGDHESYNVKEGDRFVVLSPGGIS
jgi:hypothetical protein